MQALGLALRLLLAFLACSCNGLFYFPYRGVHRLPERPYREVSIPTRDGLRLHGWFLPARAETLGTVVQFHGNAGNITSHFEALDWVTDEGFGLLVFDYRGYGQSPGRPTRAGLHADAQSAIRFAQGLPHGRWCNDIVLLGQSLGGAVLLSAYGTTTDRSRVRAVIVEGTFASYSEISASVLWESGILLPFTGLAYTLVSDEYAPAPLLARISPTPLLVVHGTADRVIQPAFGRNIFELASAPKQLWLLPGVAHLDAFRARATRERLIAYLEALEPRR